MSENVAKLITTKPDKEQAEEYRQRVIELYKPLLELFNEANKNGFIINVQAGPTPLGIQIVNLQVLKSF